MSKWRGAPSGFMFLVLGFAVSASSCTTKSDSGVGNTTSGRGTATASAGATSAEPKKGAEASRSRQRTGRNTVGNSADDSTLLKKISPSAQRELWFVNQDQIFLVEEQQGAFKISEACGKGASFQSSRELGRFRLEKGAQAQLLEVNTEKSNVTNNRSILQLEPFIATFQRLSPHGAEFSYIVPIKNAPKAIPLERFMQHRWWLDFAAKHGLPTHLNPFAGDVGLTRATGARATTSRYDRFMLRQPSRFDQSVPVFAITAPARKIASSLSCIAGKPAPQTVTFSDGTESAPWGLPLRVAFPQIAKDFAGRAQVGDKNSMSDGDDKPPPGDDKAPICLDPNQVETKCDTLRSNSQVNAYYECDITDMTLTGLHALASKSILDTQTDLTPGVLVQGIGLANNKLEPVFFKRKPVTIHVRGCSPEDVTIENVPPWDFPGAHAVMSRGLAGKCPLARQLERYSATDATSLDSFKFHVGVSGAYAGFKAKVDVTAEIVNARRVYRALYTQVWAEASVEYPQDGPISVFADLEQIVQKDQMSVDNYPALLKEVNYGRQLYLVIETDEATTKSETTAEFSYLEQQEKKCAADRSTCERNKTSCVEAADYSCDATKKPPDPASCGYIKATCVNEYDVCMDKADQCAADAMVKIDGYLHTLAKRNSTNIEAFASGPNGVTAVTAGSGTLDEKLKQIAAWYDDKPKTFDQLVPVSAHGVWLEDRYRAATYSLTAESRGTDCRRVPNAAAQPKPPVSYTVDFESIDSDAAIWEGPAAVGPFKIRAPIGTTRNQSLGPVGGTIEYGKSSTITIKLGNGNAWMSGGTIKLYRNNELVWRHDESYLVRHTGWIYRVVLDLGYDQVNVLQEDACEGWLDCHER